MIAGQDASSTVSNLVEKAKTLWSEVFGQHDVLFYVCVIVIVLYIALAKPENTPAFFSNAWTKVALSLIVFIVTLHDPVLGLLFAFAMVLSISYSYINNVNIDNYSFANQEMPQHESFQNMEKPKMPECDCAAGEQDPSCQCNSDLTEKQHTEVHESFQCDGVEGYEKDDTVAPFTSN
jgi:hypothetical protein